MRDPPPSRRELLQLKVIELALLAGALFAIVMTIRAAS